MTDKIKISVLMCAYNTEAYIAQAISSILEQSFTEFELIIVNDGSTDKTIEVIQSFKDPRIVLFTVQHKGIAAALNYGLKQAKADYIARFDADDICYHDRLKVQYEYLNTHSEYFIVGSSADYVDAEGNYIFTYHPPCVTNKEIQNIKNKVCPFVHSSVLYRKEFIIKNGGYNDNALSFEDHLLWLQVLKNAKGVNIRKPLIQVRLNPQSITIDDNWRTKRFHEIKKGVLEKETITEEEGLELLNILSIQSTERVKLGAYNSLLAKKYLWNNYQPTKAREHLKKVIVQNKLDWKSYLFYCLSFLSANRLQNLYKLLKAKF
jgi:glycosyltransferase involved in cell wall biosynthesis